MKVLYEKRDTAPQLELINKNQLAKK